MRLMNPTRMMVAIGAIGLSALASCSAPTPTATTSESPVAVTTDASAPAPQADFKALRRVVTRTRKAVKAGDIAQAKTEFAQFEAAWQKVKEEVQANSPSNYDKIEAGFEQVSAELAATQPKPDTLLAALKSLNSTIVTVGQL